MKLKLVFITFLALVLLLAAAMDAIQAAVIHVPSDQPTIQTAEGVAYEGDTILVAAGTYYENVTFTKAVCLVSEQGPDSTTIQSAVDGTAIIHCDISSSFTFTVSGFTITGARDVGDASSAIFIRGCPFSITNNWVTDNQGGTCLYLIDNAGTIINNEIWDNSGGESSGIWIVSSDGSNIGYNVIHDNSGSPCSGIRLTNTHNTKIEYNLIYNNVGIHGGAMNLNGFNNVVINNTMNNNYASTSECAVWQDAGETTIKNNIISNNPNSYAIKSFGGSVFLDYNNLWNNDLGAYSNVSPGIHDISADPEYIDEIAYDFTLQPISPCIDAGDPDPQYNDPNGTRNDMGAFPLTASFPLPANFSLESEDMQHVINHSPTFSWMFYDTVGSQAAYELEVGVDNDWSVAEMWATGEVISTDTFVTYSGIVLEDGNWYFSRLRVSNGLNWGEWVTRSFRMNSEAMPPVPARPIDQDMVGINFVLLVVSNSYDAEGDSLVYDFELYEDIGLSVLVTSQYGVPEQADETQSDVIFGLAKGQQYWWRCRADDTFEYSDWSTTESFITYDSGVILVPSEQPTIQAGIDAASDGDTVLVAPGLYYENISILTPLTLLSEHGEDETEILPAVASLPIIDAQGVTLHIEGFTFSDSEAERGLSFEQCYLTFESNTVTNNNTSGAPMLVWGIDNEFLGNCIVTNCKFINNSGESWSGGLCLMDMQEHCVIKNCEFSGNSCVSGGGITLWKASNVMVNRCIIYNNTVSHWGAGVYCREVSQNDSLLNNTIVNNSSTNNGGAIQSHNALVAVRNNIIAANECIGIKGDENCEIDYNDIWSNIPLDYDGVTPGVDDISADPLFINPAINDYRLTAGSPCVDAGDPDLAFIDPDGTRNDIGALPLSELAYPIAVEVNYGPEADGYIVYFVPPTIFWSYADRARTTQQGYEIEVGTDMDWTTAEMWSSGLIWSTDTSAVYSGLPLDDHGLYIVRIRLHDGTVLGSWSCKYLQPRLSTTTYVPTNFQTIQEAVDWTMERDTIIVSSGTYTGEGNKDIDLLGKSITLRSENGPDQTIIDCQGSPQTVNRGFYIHSGEDSTTVLQGLKIMGGYAGNGGGIYCINSSPRLVDCIFEDNHGVPDDNWGGYGGAIHCENSSMTLTECSFLSNSGGDRGGAIACFESSLIVRDCLFEENALTTINDDPLAWWTFGGGAILSYSWDGSGYLTVTNSIFRNNNAVFGCYNVQTSFIPTTIDNCTFSGGDTMNPYYPERAGVQTGGALAVVSGCSFTDLPGYAYFITGGEVILSNCTLADNEAGISCYWGSTMTIENSIITGTTKYNTVYCDLGYDISVSCSDIYGNVNGNWVDCIADQAGINGNFSLNPVFCDPDNGDYTISDWSPCAPDNNECGILIGALGVGCSLPWICGDADASGIVEVSDAIGLISYIFEQGSPPLPLTAGDVDCSGVVEISDAVYIINYVFVPDSPAPCDPDGDGEPDC